MDIADRSSDHPALNTEPFDGEMEILGRIQQASNQTFLAKITKSDDHETVLQGVYKPIKGERPLWDFPEHTLGLREVAAYRISRLGGFDVVPVTTLVEGPFGPGSLQVWVDSEPAEVDQLVDLVSIDKVPEHGWFPVVEGYAADDSPIAVVHADDPRLRMLAAFDAVINNADRKGGHILASRGRVFGVDHGVSFHVDNKLRTLLWGWAGKPLRRSELDRIRRVADGAIGVVSDLLDEDEIEALMLRAERLLTTERFPYPDDDWHTIPWPPF
ncbi:SCO1664 family protein [Microlunatus elymi]|uniref:SCO1664 family protein n=1 Tax=Microlunatus elymi TaxID=2596828 RepID=A0A516Q1Q8_9ACTN|nr:SCO1664 family protein [Microlunatus elymi]QDP97338.1 SCO1664 family protein [Microlunatus elymi]